MAVPEPVAIVRFVTSADQSDPAQMQNDPAATVREIVASLREVVPFVGVPPPVMT